MKKRNKKNGKIAPWLLVSVSLLLHGCSSDHWTEETMQTGDLVENNVDRSTAPAIKLNEDITHIWNMYEYTDISDTDTSDDDDKTELTTELLKEKNLDASVVTAPIDTKGCTFVPPEDFEELPDMEGMYVSEHYPIDVSTVYYTEKEMDISLQLMTENTFADHMKEELKKLYDSEVEIKVNAFEKITIDDFPAFKILCSYSYGDVKITQLEYIINADKSYIIIYSQTDDYDRMEEFEASAETIHVKLEN